MATATYLAWPFLVGKSSTRAIQVVVAPRFMVEQNDYGVLSTAAVVPHMREAVRNASTFACELDHEHPSNVPTFLVYRAMLVDEYYVHLEHPHNFRDESGRKIYLTEGLLIRDESQLPIITSEAIEQVHIKLKEFYRAFWEAPGSGTVRALASDPIVIMNDQHEHGLISPTWVTRQGDEIQLHSTNPRLEPIVQPSQFIGQEANVGPFVPALLSAEAVLSDEPRHRLTLRGAIALLSVLSVALVIFALLLGHNFQSRQTAVVLASPTLPTCRVATTPTTITTPAITPTNPAITPTNPAFTPTTSTPVPTSGATVTPACLSNMK